MTPIFFKTGTAFRKWLVKNHQTEKECYVGFYKVKTKKESMTWSESVDQAICYGWIDGVRRRIDEESYMIRFTPRRPTSIWSAVNIQKVKELKKANLMEEAGLAAFAKMKKANVYSFEQRVVKLNAKYEKEFKQNKKAWSWFEKSAPSYRKLCIWWVESAKREATQLRRLSILIESSEQGLKIPSQRK